MTTDERKRLRKHAEIVKAREDSGQWTSGVSVSSSTILALLDHCEKLEEALNDVQAWFDEPGSKNAAPIYKRIKKALA